MSSFVKLHWRPLTYEVLKLMAPGSNPICLSSFVTIGIVVRRHEINNLPISQHPLLDSLNSLPPSV